MINVRKNRGGNTGVNIDMGPLVDMVFLLLIFFVVTTSFVKESGIDVQRASAATAELKQRATLMIGVSPEGQVYFEGKQVDVRSVRGLIERALAENPDGGVVVVADKASRTGAVVGVMDQCRLAGAKDVSLSASRAEGGQ